MVATHIADFPPEVIELTKKQLQNAEEHGQWACGTIEASGTTEISCMTEAHSGLLSVAVSGKSATDIAKVGDEFLAAWK